MDEPFVTSGDKWMGLRDWTRAMCNCWHLLFSRDREAHMQMWARTSFFLHLSLPCPWILLRVNVHSRINSLQTSKMLWRRDSLVGFSESDDVFVGNWKVLSACDNFCFLHILFQIVISNYILRHFRICGPEKLRNSVNKSGMGLISSQVMYNTKIYLLFQFFSSDRWEPPTC